VIIYPETLKTLTALSRDTGRQLGVLINRAGAVELVLAGNPKGILIPDLSRYRVSPGRLKGLRLVHTHLEDSALSREDLTDLLLLRLDMIIAVHTRKDGLPGRAHLGMLVPASANRWEVRSFPASAGLPRNPAELIRETEQELSRHIGGRITEGVTRTLLVGLKGSASIMAEESMEELSELTRTGGMEVTGSVIQPRGKPDPRYVVGQGKLREIAIEALDRGAEMLIFDRELSPSQLRAISEVTELKVIDRTMLILDIFARHARSRGGKIQVELAQLRYLLPRLTGKGTALSRLAGGIGTRGPGETKLEVDRRRIRNRIATLKRQLEHLKKDRYTQRRKRRKNKTAGGFHSGLYERGQKALCSTPSRKAKRSPRINSLRHWTLSAESCRCLTIPHACSQIQSGSSGTCPPS